MLTELWETESNPVETAALPGARECVVIHPDETFRGKQDLAYVAGVSAQSAGARAICMHLMTMPPGGRAKAHYHASHETAIYMLEGEVETWYGERLEHRLVAHAGEFCYIPAGVPHVAVNVSQTKPASALIARTDPDEQESVVLRPDLDGIVGASGGTSGAAAAA